MTFRDRFIKTVKFEPVDRLPERHAYGLMPGVLEEWHSQGLPEEIHEDDIIEHFGFPSPSESLQLDLGPIPAFEEEILEETKTYKVAIDRWGRKTRIMKGVTTLPQGKEFPIKDWNTWKPYRHRLMYEQTRVPEEIEATAARNIQNGGINKFSIMGFYWFPRDLMGDENLALAYYDTPDLIHDINETWCSLAEQVLIKASESMQFDNIHLNEDMAYKNGSMIGKKQFDEFMAPYYSRIKNIVDRYDVSVFSVDSDGYLNELNQWFLECGVNLIGPNEVRAGNDISAYRKRYGTSMAFDGGVDKLVLTQGRRAIDAMLKKTVPAMMESGGGWVVSLDHRIVPGTPLDDFYYYLEKIRQLTEF